MGSEGFPDFSLLIRKGWVLAYQDSLDGLTRQYTLSHPKVEARSVFTGQDTVFAWHALLWASRQQEQLEEVAE